MIDTPVRYLKGVGEEREAAFQKLGIITCRDLLSHYPRDYEDRTRCFDLADITDGLSAVICGTITSPVSLTRLPGGRSFVKTCAADDTGVVWLTFFNQEFRKNALKLGERYYFYGRFSRRDMRIELINPEVTKAPDGTEYAGAILPIYPLASPLSQRLLRQSVHEALRMAGEEFTEPLPESVRREHELCDARFAVESIHFPLSMDALAIARRRLVFSELFVLSVGLSAMKKGRAREGGLLFAKTDISAFLASLPFTLTGAQARAIRDVLSDCASRGVMNRLVQGDVGSGKTMVAAAAAYAAVQNGYQCAMMSPTELLAAQHYTGLAPLFEQLGIASALLTGSVSAGERRRVLEGLRDGTISFVSGTSAVIQQGVELARLGLVICDEQHRFGVRQREALSKKGVMPHILVMSATPIPRTLALAIYGDLDVSVIDELPPGRQKIDTFAVSEDYRPRVETFVRKQVAAGHQAFIVCPLVEESDAAELKSVVAFAEKLKSDVYPDLRVSLLHGRMKPKDKERAMAAFAAGNADVLVSTTVIEVGVDVPNASLMVVENAERFGLSQLHQLRGRVGRGSEKSYCIFINQGGGKSQERLKALCATNDGFKIAETDLELRGPGDFFGDRQHGLPELKIASLSGDMRVLADAQASAACLLDDDPALSKPENAELRRAVSAMLDSIA